MMVAIRRFLRAVKILARDGRVPKPLRGLAAFAALPIPGPVDEAVLLVVGVLLWVFYRASLREAWHQASAAKQAGADRPRRRAERGADT
jgi:hypothetical protein